MTAGQRGSMAVPTTMDYRIRRKDGSYLWVETVLMAAGDSGYVCVTRDISQRKEAESNTKAMMHEIQAPRDARVDAPLRLIRLPASRHGRRDHLAPLKETRHHLGMGRVNVRCSRRLPSQQRTDDRRGRD